MYIHIYIYPQVRRAKWFLYCASLCKLTLRHKQTENGKVTMMMSHEREWRRNVQQAWTGPVCVTITVTSSSAAAAAAAEPLPPPLPLAVAPARMPP